MQPIDRCSSQLMMMQTAERQSEESSEDSFDILFNETKEYINKTKSEIESLRLIDQEDDNSLQKDREKLELTKKKVESSRRELKRSTKTIIIGCVTALFSIPIAPLVGLAVAGAGALGTGLSLGIAGAGAIASSVFTYYRAEGDACIKLILKKCPELLFIHAELLFKEAVSSIMNKSTKTQTISYRQGNEIKYLTRKIQNNATKSTKYVLEEYERCKNSGFYKNLDLLIDNVNTWAHAHYSINL